MDHLGVVAGFCKHLKLAERIDELLPAPGRKVSHGEAVVAMVLNALGFVSRPLYLFPEFFKNKPVDLLIREGLLPEDFNDDCLGRTMDVIFHFGVTEFFAALAGPILRQCAISTDIAHLDTSSFSFYGQYDAKKPSAVESSSQPSTEEPSTGESSPQPSAEEPSSQPSAEEAADDRYPIEITYGFSKDNQPNLKQAVVSLITTHQGAIPMWMEALDGNSSDKKSFPSTISAFCTQLSGDEPPLFVMDSSFYTRENLANIGNVKFITRVPHTLKEAKLLLASDFEQGDWQEGPDEAHCYRVVEKDDGGVPQRWVIVHSKERDAQDRASGERKIQKAQEQAEKDANQMSGRRFDCQADAHEAVRAMSQKWPFHEANVTLVEHKQFKTRGRPKKDQLPEHITWQARVEVVQDPDAVAASRHGDGMYIIATNELSEERMSALRLIALYKEQGTTVERGFRFLKDPLFFASAIYLHKPQRIMALMMLMTLSLLIYALAEKHVREELVNQRVIIPDQKGKPTQRPTLRRIFQMFEGLDLLVIQSGEQVNYQLLNLNEIHRDILRVLPKEVENLYLRPGGCGT